MNMHILVKTIDVYKSKKHKNKTIAEFIVYLMLGDTPVSAEIAFGEEAKDLVILSFVKQYTNQSEITITQKN